MNTAKRLALVFPGQGSQRVGMGKDLLTRWPRTFNRTMEEASETMQMNLKRLILDGPQEQLRLTQYTQPALLAHSISVLRILQEEGGLEVATPPCSYVLGHSLGEYSALVASGVFSFTDAIRLVHFRGRVMQEAVPAELAAMAALMPMGPEAADELCKEVAGSAAAPVCQVANYNSKKQTVISGNVDAVEEAMAKAKAEKGVRRAVRLDVSAPFHCRMMTPAAKRLREKLEDMEDSINSTNVPIVWNVEGASSDKSRAELIDALVYQVTEPVRWSQSVDYCLDQGVEEFIEIGPGNVLTSLIKQHAPKANAKSCGTADEIKSFLG